jgi:hypothetical protein
VKKRSNLAPILTIERDIKGNDMHSMIPPSFTKQRRLQIGNRPPYD